MKLSQEILEAALFGLEAQREKLLDQITSIKTMTGAKAVGRPRKKAEISGDSESTATATKKAKKKRKRILSPEARERIAAAQKKRWATFRGEV